MKILKVLAVLLVVLITFGFSPTAKANGLDGNVYDKEEEITAADDLFGEAVGEEEIKISSIAANSKRRPLILEAPKNSFKIFPGYHNSGIGYSREVYVSFTGLNIGYSEENEIILQDEITRKQKIIGSTYPAMAKQAKQYQTVYFPSGKELTTSWNFYFADKPDSENHILKVRFRDQKIWKQYEFPFETPDVQAAVNAAGCVFGGNDYHLEIVLTPFFGNQIAAGNPVTLKINGQFTKTVALNEYWYYAENGWYVPHYWVYNFFSPDETELIQGEKNIVVEINNGTQIFRTGVKNNFFSCR